MKKKLLLIASIVIGVVTLEVAARVEDKIKWNAPFFENYSNDSLFITDELGRHGRPNGQFEKWRLNNHGFRGPNVEYEKKEGVKRIIVLGASESFGLYESPEKEFPAQLRSLLDERMPGQYELINMSTVGMSLARMKFLYEKQMKDFKPDAAVIYPSPSFYLTINAPKKITSENLEKADPRGEKPRSRILDKLSRPLKAFLPEKLQDAMKMAFIKFKRSRENKDWVWDAPPQERVQLFQDDLLELIKLLQRDNVQVYLVTHTNCFENRLYGLQENALNERERGLLHAWQKFYLRADGMTLLQMEDFANKVMVQAALNEKVVLVNLDATLPKTEDNFADFVHFTDKGAAMVADILFQSIISSSRTEG